MECKICRGPTAFFGAANFNKNCEERRGLILPPHAEVVTYVKCEHCGTIFTADFDAWTSQDFARRIYNDEYVLIDTDVVEARPRHNAQLIADLVVDRGVSILDYGGHAGYLSRMLRDGGFSADSWDPYGDPAADAVSATATAALRDRYDFIASFEVLEHTVDPDGTVADMVGRLATGGAILFSTYVLDFETDVTIDHWYISPRNGHVTVHSRRGLSILFGRHEMRVHHYSRGLHLAWHDGMPLPAWLTREPIGWTAVPGEVLRPPSQS